MDKTAMIAKVNGLMKNRIGYEPFVLKNNKIVCRSCWTEMRDVDESALLKTSKIQNSKNVTIEVHQCPCCKYMKGVNVSLKKRISDIRKELGLFEFPGDTKYKNEYCTPQLKYNFIDQAADTVLNITEEELYDIYNKFKNTNLNSPTPAEIVTPEEPPKVEEQLSKSTEDDDSFFKDDKTSEVTNITEETISTETIPQTDIENVDEVLTQTDESFSEVRDEKESLDMTTEENSDDLLNIFQNEQTELDTTTASTDNTDTTESGTIADTDQDDDDLDEFNDDIIDDFFSDKKQNEEHSNDSKKSNTTTDTGRTGVTDVKYEKDSNIDKMIKDNLEDAEADVFRINDRKDHVFNIVRNSRITDLMESFNDGNAKTVLDRILTLFEKRSGKKLTYKIYISELTHECPVIDLEGNIRLIFVDLDVPGGQYHVQNEINNRLKPTFENSSEYELMTYLILSDMVKTNTLINKVVRAVSKVIAYNLKIRGIFPPVSIVKDSDKYFYTTMEYDSDTIERFCIENSAGNMDMPCNGKIAIVSHWDNPSTNEVWKYRKELSNRAVLARGGDINYKDLSMFMNCSLKYIILPKRPDGVISITIVEYVESLDLFIRDGFGTLVGVLVHNVKMNNPDAKIDVYYEIDPTTIPSPCISRYIKNSYIRPIDQNPDVKQLNTIIEKVSAQHGVQPVKLPVEGEPFDSPEYQSNYKRTYVLSAENRRYTSDDKRIDWRRFGRKAFAKTLGERFKDYKNIDVNDRRARQSVLEKIGYETVIQPQVIETIVVKDFCRNALIKVMETCSGLFSISQYIAFNRSMVVDDNYMMGGGQQMFNQSPYFNTQQNPYQQFQQPQFFNGGFQQPQPQQENPMFRSFDSLIASAKNKNT